MITCRECGHQEFAGAMFCGDCGLSLLELGGKVAVVDEEAPPEKPPALIGQGTKPLDNDAKMVLMIPISGRRLTYPLKEYAEIRVGRGVPEDADPPELNLTHDNGAQYGVSRLHALFQLTEQGMVVTDLNSTNGTTLNNFPLPPELPYPVQHGDEVQFGNLLVHLFFK